MCIMDPSDLEKGVWEEVLRRPAFLFPDSAEAPCARAAASSFLDEKLLSSLHPKEIKPSIQKRSKRKWGYNIPLPRPACASEKSSSISTSDECSSASDSDDSFTNNDDKENSSPNLRALESEGEKRKTDRVDELNDLPAATAYEEASVMHAPAAAMADDMSLVMPSSTLPRCETTPEEPWVYPNGLRKMHEKLLDQERPRIATMPPQVRIFLKAAQNLRVPFKGFQKAWESIGGKINGLNNGGSHRHIIAPDDTPLWGTFDHGGFGKRTIPYLTAAFAWWGYR